MTDNYYSHSPYAKYSGQSVGRILHFIYHYCGSHLGEHVQVGFATEDNKSAVRYGGDIIATYTWDSDVPTFDFFPKGWDEGTGSYKPYDQRVRDTWVTRQRDLADIIKYPIEYRRELLAKLKRFKDNLDRVDGLDLLMTSSMANPPTLLVEKWSKMVNGLPIDEVQEYIRCAKLYEAFKAEKA